LLSGRFAVCQLAPRAVIPEWAQTGCFVSITRTNDELSIVCAEGAVPEGIKCERGWRCLRVADAMAFSITGVLASLVSPLAAAQISVFAIATFDTDYLLVKEDTLSASLATLGAAGHSVKFGQPHDAT
jgi:hypothetical protein